MTVATAVHCRQTSSSLVRGCTPITVIQLLKANHEQYGGFFVDGCELQLVGTLREDDG